MTPRLVGTALYLEHGGDGIIVDAPAGVAQALGLDLGRVRAIVLPTGRASRLSGLIELLSALEPHRTEDQPLALHVPLGEERGPALAEVWSTHWGGFPLVVDAQRPGAPFEVGPFEVETLAIRVGEPRWQPDRIERRVGMALRVTAGGRRVAIVLGAAPEPSLARWCTGSDLAVVEVGAGPWPKVDQAWRLRTDEALEIGSRAAELWVVGGRGSTADN